MLAAVAANLPAERKTAKSLTKRVAELGMTFATADNPAPVRRAAAAASVRAMVAVGNGPGALNKAVTAAEREAEPSTAAGIETLKIVD